MGTSAKESTKQKKARFIQCLKKKAGNISVACEEIGITRQCYYQWKAKDAKFAEEIAQVDESLLDFAESALMRAMKEGNSTAIIFYLKTKGRARGYNENITVDQHTTLEIEKPMTPAEAQSFLENIDKTI